MTWCMSVSSSQAKLAGLDTLLMRGGAKEACEILILPDGKPHKLLGELRYARRPDSADR